MAHQGVESSRRFIQNKQFRVLHKSLNYGEFLLVARRILLNLARWVKIEPLDEVVFEDRRPVGFKGFEQAQGFGASQLLKETDLARDVADTAAYVE